MISSCPHSKKIDIGVVVAQRNSGTPCVHVIDDDPSIRHAMTVLLKSVGIRSRVYASGSEFLDEYSPGHAGCIVLDIRMPGMGGLELRGRLKAIGCVLPIIFVTGYGDVPMAVEAMQQGAFDFVEKPFRDQEILDRISAAIDAESERRVQAEAAREVDLRRARLTKREREVLDLIVTGKPNKVVAHELGVSQRTVEIHRSRVMEKMQARSLAELVRMQLVS